VKGVDEKGYVVNQIVEDVAWLGYSKCVLKTDNEPAIVQVLKESLKALKVKGLDQVQEEHPPPYDSQANGSIEVGVKMVRGMVRTVQRTLENRIGFRIPPGHAILKWLVAHAADLLTRRQKGHDGNTPYQRVKGRPYTGRLLEFGEKCRFKVRSKEPLFGQARWGQGIFVGICRATGQYIIYDVKDDKMAKARTVMRLPNVMKWNKDDIEALTHTPYTGYEPKEPGVTIREQIEETAQQVRQEQSAKPRSMYVRPSDMADFGHTDGCPKCDHVLRYGPHRAQGKAHSEACRNRMIKELEKTQEGRDRLEGVRERQNQVLAERVEAAAQHQAVGEELRQAAPTAADAGMSTSASTRREDFDMAFERIDVEPQAIASGTTTTANSSGDTPGIEDGEVIEAAEEMDDKDENEEIKEGDIDMDIITTVLGNLVNDKIRKVDKEINALVNGFGGDGGKYRRERKKALNRMIAEIYSPPRVTEAAKLLPDLGCIPGFALDLTTMDENGKPWDFDRPEQRKKAWQLLEEKKPMLLIGTPMCTAFSAWQRINNMKRDADTVTKEWTRAMVHLRFCCQLYRHQAEQGRFFLHEHPAQASSWATRCVEEIKAMKGVMRVTAHQCQYGAETGKGDPVKKPTTFMTNCAGVAEELVKTCEGQKGFCSRVGGGAHALCNGRVARQAAVFPFELCRAILTGFRRQMVREGRMMEGVVGMQEPVDLSVFITQTERDGKVYDDMTGQELPYELVVEARRKELEYFKKKNVWVKKLVKECINKTGKPPISVRWVDTNKGDDVNPEIRSRLVARQIRGPGQDSVFAPTPPLEALRTVLSIATTNLPGKPRRCWDPMSEERTQISFIDISRAYFNAKTDPEEPTYVQLPTEDPDSGRGMCGLLMRHMYGTQKAAEGWQQEYSRVLVEELGFVQGVASPCLFTHEKYDITCSVHGDDFTAAGPKSALDWYEVELEKHYELRKGARIGPGPQDDKEATVLNRVVRWTDDGVEYEADPRQAEKLIEGLDLKGANPAATPGLKITAQQIQDDKPLAEELNTKFRGLAARANYLSADRPDCQFAAKETCRWMAAPTELAMAALKRLGRYLIGRPRMVFTFKFQEAETLECYSDTDWAGCPRTRKSTSGGALMLGGHVLKTWSSTQPSVTLSSGEAEFYGVVKAAGTALGQQSLMRDLGIKVKVRVWTDSSAAMGVCTRQGLGKLRHLETHTLWVQEKVRNKSIELRKVRGDVNPADLFTKYLPAKDKISQLVSLFECRYMEGRAVSAPLLREKKEESVDENLETYNIQDEENVNYKYLKQKLPHKFGKDEVDRLFPKVQADVS